MASPGRAPPPTGPALLPDTRVLDLADGATGEVRRLFVHVPPGEPPPGGWPLLVMLDGNAVIATAVDAVRAQGPYPGGTNVVPGVVAAIGYRGEAAFDLQRRSFDLTLPPGRSYPPFAPGGPPALTGGADPFLRFVEEDALPAVEGLAPIRADRRTLFGHSFGGSFALYALFRGTPGFTRFVAASPAIAWEDGVLLAAEAGFSVRARRGGEIVVHLSAGEHEGEALAPFQDGREDARERLATLRAARTLALAGEMAGRLAALPGLRVRFERFADETHMSVLPVAVARAVRVAFEPG